MASHILLAACLFVTVLKIASSIPSSPEPPLQCRENEEYYSCYLYRCQRTCVHLKENAPCLPLAPGCYSPGCECVDGFYKNSKGLCVPEKECET